MKFSKKNIFLLSLLTLIGFSAVGFLLIYIFLEVDPITFLKAGDPVWKQLLYGSIFGITGVFNAIWLINLQWLQGSKDYFGTIIRKLDPNIAEVFFYSLCAGIGEEILFRGAIQPHLGIWPTAILFIVLHGYLSISNIPMMLYGILMVVFSAGMGYLFEIFGIHASIAAHFFFDFFMFIYLIKGKKITDVEKEEPQEE